MLSALAGRIYTRMASNAAKFTNKLAHEKSPYLLQHQHNPIEWYPWGEEAFNLAKTKNKPIFLSVGYSTCHWCHVMERESFENEEIAHILNSKFVSIKVDREERPDVDRLYMMFVQATTGGGGWPMSVFLTPELEPFLGGTYFPPFDKHGRPGFSTLLQVVSQKWEEDTEILRTQGRTVMRALAKVTAPGEHPPVETAVQGIYQYLCKGYDKTYGGFGIAPKFPKAVDLNFLLNFIGWTKTEAEKEQAKKMLEHTLKAMAQGGIHDHIGKGFHRYSVDEEWHVPHFEKMLYDQAQLLGTYADFSSLTGGSFSNVVRDIADYMTTYLMHPEGGFYAAEDADSLPTSFAEHKKEGAFCVWTKEQVCDILKGLPDLKNHSTAEVFCNYFDIKDEGNVPHIHDPHGELAGMNVLRCKVDDGDFAKNLGVTEDELRRVIENCKELLVPVRLQRPPPHLDSKMVTAWQGLAISGFSKAYLALSDMELRERAEDCAKFVEKHLMNDQGHLLRAVYRGDDCEIVHSEHPVPAFSDDYAFVIEGFLDLYSCSGDENYLRRAFELQKVMDEKFYDHTSGTGYFISELGGPGADVRIQEDQDGAEPCANSVAVSNLARLAEIFENHELSQRAEKIIAGAAQKLARYPYILSKMTVGFKCLEDGYQRVVIVGNPEDEKTEALIKTVFSNFAWNRCVIHLNPNRKDSFLPSTSPSYAPMLDVTSPTVFICEGSVCSLPITSTDELKAKLAKQ